MTDRAKVKNQVLVGVGASAGGLEALVSFFRDFPVDTGLSFVVVQHLSPDFKSLMDELLARHTSMKIYRVEKETRIRPNCIYLIQPKNNLTVRGLKLIPSDQDPKVQLRLPIDWFFTSLANEYGANAIGVVLSGTGSDGTRGCGSIKEHEGFVIAQDPASCRFDGMPKGVIRYGLPDRVLPPEEMADAIIQYACNPESVVHSIDLEREPDKHQLISSLLLTIEGIDFANYRPSTIERRIERRVKVNRLRGLDDYINLLRRDVTELKTLHSELLIGVTRFFRNAEAFDFLQEKVIPGVFENAADDDVVRVWVAGCATGQEAYSLAMCLLDFKEVNSIQKELKIFATDVDREALEIAATGRYPESIAQDVSPERLQKYFVKKEDCYEVTSELRRTIIFSPHNAIKDPPFTKTHLVSCRNLLIYFKTELQLRAISLFHFSLKSNGYLFLGKSEALGDLASEFIVVGSSQKIYQKLRDVKLAKVSQMGLGTGFRQVPISASRPRGEVVAASLAAREPRINHVYESLLNEYVPPCVLIDEHCELMHVFGDASRFLEIPTGKSTNNVLKMIDRELSLALSTAVARAKKIGEEVVFEGVRKSIDSGSGDRFRIRVKPYVAQVREHVNSYMVLFEEILAKESPEPKKVEVYDPREHAREHIENLEEQLTSTRESLQTTIEELETTNEELQSTNEELMSSNEELQSSNEELQSVNEELYTVNTEHQEKIDEVSQVNSDIDFLLRSSNIGIMFLDGNLRIRRYNKGIQAIINVMPQDIGRRITDITFNSQQQEILQLIKETAKSGASSAREVELFGNAYLIRAVAYNQTNHGEDARKRKTGIVLSFVEVPSLTEANELRRLTADAEEFNYAVSHDLHKPMRRLAQINKGIEKLCSGRGAVSKSRLKEASEESAASIEVMREMLDVLLKYSRLRTRGSNFRMVSISHVLRKAVRSFRGAGNEAHIEVPELPPSDKMFCDTNQMIELFSYLIENALENSYGKRKVRVKISVHSLKGWWEFGVSDNGKGMSSTRVTRAFEIFSSLSLGGQKGKLGVGLPLSKRIVQRHGGEIWIQSQPRVGTTVGFTIPIQLR